MFRGDRNTGNKGGGVLLYIRDFLLPVEFQRQSFYGEHVWCWVGDLLIGCVTGSRILRWWAVITTAS